MMRAAERVGYPVVLKPLAGNHGRGVSINLRTAEDVETGFAKASEHGRTIIVVEGEITAEIDAFNAVNKEETEQAGVHYADITPYSRQAKDDLSLIAADGLHPSGKMYRLWVEEIMKEFLFEF